MAHTIPVPFTTGDMTMDGGSYTGDVGSTDRAHPATLRLTNGAKVDATVGGFQDPGAQPGITPAHYADFEVYGKDDKLTLSQVGGGRTLRGGPGFAQVNLLSGAELDGAQFTAAADGFVSYNGGTLKISGAH